MRQHADIVGKERALVEVGTLVAVLVLRELNHHGGVHFGAVVVVRALG